MFIRHFFRLRSLKQLKCLHVLLDAPTIYWSKEVKFEVKLLLITAVCFLDSA